MTLYDYGNDCYTHRILSDYNGDSLTDLAILRSDTLVLMIDYSANGYGQWDYPSSTRNIPMRSMRSAILYTPFVGDFDGDRKSDFVYRDEGRSVLKIGYQRNNYQITDSLTEYGKISWAIPAAS